MKGKGRDKEEFARRETSQRPGVAVVMVRVSEEWRGPNDGSQEIPRIMKTIYFSIVGQSRV